MSKFQITQAEAAMALERSDSESAIAKLLECVTLAEEYRSAVMGLATDRRRAAMFDTANAILVSATKRALARARRDEAGYVRALEDQVRLIEDFIVHLKTHDDTRESVQLVHGALLARARLRARLANAQGDEAAELAAWNDARVEAAEIRGVEKPFMGRTALGMLFCGGGDYWCGINFSLHLSEPGLLLAEPSQRARTHRVRTAQQQALAEYELPLREALIRAKGSECPEYWQCQHALAELELIEAGY